MAIDKYNYLLLEAFIKQNRQFTEAEQKEILALDKDYGHQPVISDPKKDSSYFTDVGFHVLDKTEIKDFFEKQNITYKNLVDPEFNRPHWSFRLAHFITRNLNQDQLDDVIKLEGFPIKSQESLSTDAQANLKLVFEYIDEKLKDKKIDFKKIETIFKNTPFYFTEARIVNPVSENERPALEISIEKLNLFWDLIDPKNKNPQLKLKILSAIEKANLVYYQKLKESLDEDESVYIYHSRATDGLYVQQSDLKDWWLTFKNEFDKPLLTASEVEIADPLKELKSRIEEEIGIKFIEEKRNEFEIFIGRQDFREACQSEGTWVEKISEEFLSYFEIPQNTKANIVDNTLIITPDLNSDNANQKSVAIKTLMLACGYQQAEDYYFAEFDRIVEYQYRDHEIYTQTNGADNTIFGLWYTDLESKRGDNIVFLEETLLRLHSNWNRLPDLCRHDLYRGIFEKTPWLEEALSQIEAEDFNQSILTFAKDYQVIENLQLYGDVEVLMTEPYISDKIMEALKQNPNPKACLLFLLYVASLELSKENDYGYGFVSTNLPLILAQLQYDNEVIIGESGKVTYYSENNQPENNIETSEDFRVPQNAWVKTTKEGLVQVAKRLSEVSADDIKKLIEEIESDYLDEKYGLINPYFTSKKTTFLEPKTREITFESEDNESGFLEKEWLLKKIKLKTLRDKISALDPLLEGKISIIDLLSLDLTGSENKELKSILKNKKIFFTSTRNDIQIELLSRRSLKANILDNNFSIEHIWAKYFRRDEDKALNLVEKIIKKHEKSGESDENMIYKLTLLGAFASLYSSQNPKAVEIIKKYRDEFGSEPMMVHKIRIKSGEISELTAPIGFLKNQLNYEDDEKSESQFVNELAIKKKEINFISSSRSYIQKYRDRFGDFDETFFRTSFKDEVDEKTLDIIFMDAENKSDDYWSLCEDFFNKLSFLFQGIQTLEEEGLSENIPLTETMLRAFEETGFILLDDQAPIQLVQKYVDLASQVMNEHCDRTFIFQPIFKITEKFSKDQINYPQNIILLAALFNRGDSNVYWDKLDHGLFIKKEKNKTVFDPQEKLFGEKNRLLFEFVDEKFPIINFFKKLIDIYGPLTFLENSSEFYYLSDEDKMEEDPSSYRNAKNVYYIATYATNSPHLEISDDEIFELASLAEYVISRGNKDFISFYSEIILNLRKHKDQLVFKDKMSEEVGLVLMNPDEALVESVKALSRYDDVLYPENITDWDKTGIPIEEIPSVKEDIYTYYYRALFVLEILHFYQKNNLNNEIENLVGTIENLKKQQTNLSPLLDYILTLALGILGDRQAIQKLRDYDSGKIKLFNHIDIFVVINKMVLGFGSKLLQQIDPAGYFWKSDEGRLKDDSLMALIEMAYPDINSPGIKKMWQNVSNPQPYDSPDSVKHATSMANVLGGQFDFNTEPNGKIMAYNLDETKNTWEAFDAALDEIIEDVKQGHPILVVSISLGKFGYDVGFVDYQKLVHSEIWISLQQKIKQLKKYKIPIVIGSGNDGDGSGSTENLSNFNMMATLDSSLIIVASSKRVDPFYFKDMNRYDENPGTHIASEIGVYPFEISHFSSPGFFWVGPDFATIGEGYNYITTNGVEKDGAGTSPATALTARLIAKMREMNPKLSVEKIQAILKMSAHDMQVSASNRNDSIDPTREGAGNLEPAQCLYLTFLTTGHYSNEEKQAAAQKYGVTENLENLDYLHRRINSQVFWKNTFKQNYGD